MEKKDFKKMFENAKKLVEKKHVKITIGVMCAILVFMISLQFKIVQRSDSNALKAYNEDQLRNEILKWKEKYDSAITKLEDDEVKLEEYRKAATQTGQATEVMKSELADAQGLLRINCNKRKGINIQFK